MQFKYVDNQGVLNCGPPLTHVCSARISNRKLRQFYMQIFNIFIKIFAQISYIKNQYNILKLKCYVVVLVSGKTCLHLGESRGPFFRSKFEIQNLKFIFDSHINFDLRPLSKVEKGKSRTINYMHSPHSAR